MFRQNAFLSTALVTMLMAAPALAISPMGEITGEIGDEAFLWETLDVPEEGTATAEFEAFGPVTSVTIQGHEQGGESLMRNVVSLTVSLMGEGASASVMDVDVSFFPEGMSGAFYMSTDAPRAAEISFDKLDLAGEEGRAEGSFSALLCRQDDFMTPPDVDDCIEARGEFATSLRGRS